MARCPHLGLEEYGTSPFPFPSPSHHCYLLTPGLQVGQREQQRYCLSKRYEDCPLYASHFPQETLAATLPGTSPGPEIGMESPFRAPAAAREADEGTRDKAPQVAGPPTAPEPDVQPASTEEVKRPLPREGLIQEPPVSRASTGVTGAAEASPEINARARSPVSKTLLWTAMGGALLLFVCVGGLVVIAVASSSARLDTTSLQLISLTPSALLTVSLASFGGAISLLALLIWALRQGPR